MDIFTQKKLLLWTVALLTMLNIASLAMVWYQHSMRPGPPDPQAAEGPPVVQRFLERELGLSDTQKQAFEKLRKEHFQDLSRIQAEIHDTKRALTDEITAPAPDSAKVGRLLLDIGNKEVLFERTRFEHFMILKNICTPAQQDKFKGLLHEILEAGRPAGPPPPGPDGRAPRRRDDDHPPPRERPAPQDRN